MKGRNYVEDCTWMSVRSQDFQLRWSFARYTIVYCQWHVLGSSSFHGWESYSFQEIFIRCTFIYEDAPQSPFVDFLDFSSFSFAAVVPDLVTIHVKPRD